MVGYLLSIHETQSSIFGTKKEGEKNEGRNEEGRKEGRKDREREGGQAGRQA